MSSHWPRRLLAMFSLLGVLTLVMLDLEYAAPGQLGATHSQVEELVGPERCVGCHGAAGETFRITCAGCHEPIEQQLLLSQGFHGQLERAADCGLCHLEHAEVGGGEVTSEVFALAGVPVREEYRHEGLAFELDGVHEALACDSCHDNSEISRLPVGATRFLGLTQDCASCHETPHPAEQSNQCADCHGQNGPFEILEDFEHDASFPLIGAHAEIGCYDCHEQNTAHSVENVRSRTTNEVRTCGQCHDDSHSDNFLTRIGSQFELTRDDSCSLCHESSWEGFSRASSDMDAKRHAATGFKLTEPHATAECAACHDPDLSLAQRYPGRAAKDCAACHEDPHAEQFALPTSEAKECVDCHSALAFTEHTFDAASHAMTSFPLDGAHGDLDCAECHTPNVGTAIRQFRGTSAGCAECHEDVHGTMLGNRHRTGRPISCSVCHNTSTFQDVAADVFSHGTDTGFDLRGVHAELKCNRCHQSGELNSALANNVPARFGHIRQTFPGSLERCDTCHEDVHEGRFRLHPETNQRTDCITCHDEASFSTERSESFAHTLWTGFELRGAHARAECTSCHGTAHQATAMEPRLGLVSDRYEGSLERCDTCHEDVHNGRLSRDPATGQLTDCSQCHSDEVFTPHLERGFLHAPWTGFALEGVHAETTCNSCHPTTQPDATGRTFGRALGSACADCHQDPHLGQLQLNGVNDCARCHASNASFADFNFDHQRDSSFKLDETHIGLECSACHQTWSISDNATVVRYKPLGQECADCHLPERGQDL